MYILILVNLVVLISSIPLKNNMIALAKGTIDGGIGYLLPLTERVYRRLDMTQKLLCSMIPHTAALNPRTYRYINLLLQALFELKYCNIVLLALWIPNYNLVAYSCGVCNQFSYTSECGGLFMWSF